MSSVIKTNTVFTDKECLVLALKAVGTNVSFASDKEILTDRIDFYGPEKFVFENGRFIFYYDSWADHMGWLNQGNLKKWLPTAEWLKEVDSQYRKYREEKMERLSIEKRKIEEEKIKKLNEQRCNEIITKAKNEGYDVAQVEEDGKIRLVLTRITY